jgi:ComF family protein
MIKSWLNQIQNCLLPPTCILCDNQGFDRKDICVPCFQLLAKNTTSCHQCGRYLEKSSVNTVCGECLKNPPAFAHTIAPFIYQDAISYLIKGLKFNNQYKNARLLGMLFAEQLPENTELPQCIIPVPLHKNRYQERGFNQSLEIARSAAKQLKIPLDLNSCIRHRDTPHQVSLPAKHRHQNIKDAFSIAKPIHYSHVAVFDDVMTTGSTVQEMAKVLKKAGVKKVDVWVCARA